MTSTPAPGDVVHVASDLRYYGRFTVASVDLAARTVIVTGRGGRGRAAFDQLFATKLAGQAHVKALSSGSLAELGGNRAARKAAR